MRVVSISKGLVLLLLATDLAGCGFSPAPSAPSPVPHATPTLIPISLVLFTDPVSRVSTADVRDAQEQIVRFNTAGELVWTVDDTRFPGYPVDLRGPFVGGTSITKSALRPGTASARPICADMATAT